MDRNNLLKNTFEIVTWPEIQDYMTIDNFRENAILINIVLVQTLKSGTTTSLLTILSVTSLTTI